MKLKMYLTVLTYLKLNVSIWTASTVFTAAVAKLDLGIKAIKADDQVDKKTNSETLSKHQKRVVMLDATKVVCNAGTAYATTIDDPALRLKFDFSDEALNEGNEETVYNRCVNIGKAAVGLETELESCGMPVGQLAIVASTAKDYNDDLTINREKRTTGKTANKDLTLEYKAVDVILKKLLDKLVNNYKKDNPKFWAGYQDTRYIGGWTEGATLPPDPPTA